MTVGILQLQARGEQDEHFIGNPEVSFYKFAYKKHTNFSMQTYELLFNSSFKWGQRSECQIPRRGDLLSRMYLQINLPVLSTDRSNTAARWVSNVGHVLIKSIEIDIGGQRIDIQTGEYLYICNQLNVSGSKKSGLDYMVGYDVDPYQEKIIYIPLQFWFNKHSNLALPLIALRMHDIKIRLNLRTFEEVTEGVDTPIELNNISIIADYILLDVDERTKLQNGKHQYIIEQVQSNIENRTNQVTNTIDLMFKNNVKEIFWMVRRYVHGDIDETDSKDWFDYTFKNNANPIKKVSLKINGQDKISELPGEYFNLIQPYQHHSSIPDNPGICVYNFGLNPESFQPSGSCNFTCIDNAELQLELYHDYFLDFGVFEKLRGSREVSIQVYATSYNILEVEDGKSRLIYE